MLSSIQHCSKDFEIPGLTDEGLDPRISEGFRGKVKEDTDNLTNDFFDTLLAALRLYDVMMIFFTSGQQRDPSQHVLVGISNAIWSNSS